MPWRSRAYCRFAAENPCVGGSIPPLATKHLAKSCGVIRTTSPCVAGATDLRWLTLYCAQARSPWAKTISGLRPGDAGSMQKFAADVALRLAERLRFATNCRRERRHVRTMTCVNGERVWKLVSSDKKNNSVPLRCVVAQMIAEPAVTIELPANERRPLILRGEGVVLPAAL